jgi:hypothetical protein
MEQKRQKVKEESAELVVGLGTAIELQGRSGMNVTSKGLTHPCKSVDDRSHVGLSITPAEAFRQGARTGAARLAFTKIRMLM